MSAVIRLFAIGGVLVGLSACSIPFLSSEKNGSTADVNQPADVQAGQVAVINSDIIVNEPLSNDTISSPLLVAGRTRTFAGGIVAVLKDAGDLVLATSTATILGGSDDWRQYSSTLTFGPSLTEDGWVEVYAVNAEDNTVRDVIRLPIRFSQFQKPVVKVFFNNTEGDPALVNCEAVFPVEREVELQSGVSYGNQLVSAALNQLLSGPTAADKNNGFISQLPAEGVQVQKAEVKDGVFYIDFNQALQAGVAGSCRVLAIRAQITETLKQFNGVTSVVISIDGKTEEILQP